MTDDPEAPGEAEDSRRVKFDYIKSNFFREIAGHGAFGSVTPRLEIYMALYSERPVIPRQVSHRLNPDGTLGKEVREERIARETNAIREVEFGVTMSHEVARRLAQWLSDRADQIEKIINDSETGDETGDSH